MKHRRQRVSRSTLKKYGAELEQRLREQSAQERREKLNRFRDWLRVKFSLSSLVFVFFLVASTLLLLGSIFLIGKLLIILPPIYSARLGIPLPAAIALFIVIGLTIRRINSWFNLPICIVLKKEDQIHYEFSPIWLFRRNQLDYKPGFEVHTFLAINVIGGLLPLILALYQFNRIPPLNILLVTAITTTVCYFCVEVFPGMGIFFKPCSFLIVSIITALSALLLVEGGIDRIDVSVAFAGGVLGALIGADLLHLKELQVENSVAGPMSIGGGGKHDGIFLCGFYSLLVAEWMPNFLTFLKL